MSRFVTLNLVKQTKSTYVTERVLIPTDIIESIREQAETLKVIMRLRRDPSDPNNNLSINNDYIIGQPFEEVVSEIKAASNEGKKDD